MKILKNLFLFLTLPTLMFGQINSKFLYGISVINNKENKMLEMMETLSPNYINAVSTIDFTLNVNKAEASSSFIVNKKTVPDDVGAKLFLTMSDYSGQINQLNDSLYIEKDSDLYDKKYTTVDTINKSWKIFNENKEIFGYKCYKATCIKTVVNAKGVFKNEVIAWFCPEIPYQFGPFGYGKLPGLIFELQTKYALIGIKYINLVDETPNLKIDKSRFFLKNDDFEKMVLKSIKQRRSFLEGN